MQHPRHVRQPRTILRDIPLGRGRLGRHLTVAAAVTTIARTVALARRWRRDCSRLHVWHSRVPRLIQTVLSVSNRWPFTQWVLAALITLMALPLSVFSRCVTGSR